MSPALLLVPPPDVREQQGEVLHADRGVGAAGTGGEGKGWAGAPWGIPRAAIPFPSGVLLSPLSYPLKFLFLDMAPRSKCGVWGGFIAPTHLLFHFPLENSNFLRNYGQFAFHKPSELPAWLPAATEGFCP